MVFIPYGSLFSFFVGRGNSPGHSHFHRHGPPPHPQDTGWGFQENCLPSRFLISGVSIRLNSFSSAQSPQVSTVSAGLLLFWVVFSFVPLTAFQALADLGGPHSPWLRTHPNGWKIFPVSFLWQVGSSYSSVHSCMASPLRDWSDPLCPQRVEGDNVILHS